MRRSLFPVFCTIGLISVSVIALRGQAAPPASQEDAGQPQNPIVPVHHEPHHRQVFQYGTTRILDLQIPPGDTSWFHSHEWPVMYMTLSTSQTRTQILGQEWGRGGRGGGPAAPGGAAAASGRAAAAGGTSPEAEGTATPARAGGPPAGRGNARPGVPRATSTTSYFERPVTHRLQNIGTGLFRAMVVVNETPGDETVTEEAAGFTAKPELTNRWFRAYRIVLEPGEKSPSHRHNAPVVIFQATAGKGLGAGAMKFEFNEPGQWAFFDTGDSHDVRNSGDGRIELIEVEVRRK